MILPAQPVGDGRWIQAAVDRLQPNGSTNLHAGLMLGFQEVDRNFDIRRNNRVMLLSDGIANQGVTNPEQIAQEALAYNQRGINLSTIGLGKDFNDTLLSTLARQGKGAYHFIDSAQEMDKVFRAEVEGLVEKVAGSVSVAVKPAPGVALREVTGFDGTPPADGAQVQVQDMGAGDSQVLLVRLQAPPGPAGSRALADVTVSYTDPFAQRTRSAAGQAVTTSIDMPDYDPLSDVEVLRNVTIKASAEALQNISTLANGGQYQQAWQLAYDMEQQLRKVGALTADEQMVQDADLFRRYQVTLSQYLPVTPTYAPPTSEPSTQPQRWAPLQSVRRPCRPLS